MITQELFDACEFAKTAADMSIPVEPMPTPEPGSEAIDGMVNGSMMDPNSVGAGTYAGAVDQAALAQAKARAAAAAQAAAAQKTAAIEEAFEMGYFDAMYEYDEMNKIASVEDAYEMGYAAAIEELEKIAGVLPNAARYTKKNPSVEDLVAAAAVPTAGKSNRTGMKQYSKEVVNANYAGKQGLTLGDKYRSAKAHTKRFLRHNQKAVGAATAAAALGGIGGAAAHNAIAARRKAQLMRRAGIGGAALAGLAGLGYAAHKARD